MAFASLSILGLYEWNTDIFANLTLPSGMDINILIPELVTECADFPLLYPDYDFMKMLIGVWSAKEQKIWADMYRSESFVYNPIENYDRHEEITRTITGESESSGTSQSTTQDSRTTNDTNSGTTVNAQTAYNSVAFADTNKATTNGTATETDSATGSATGSNSAEISSTGTESVVSHMHGNIGVTTAQQMIEGFRAISDFCTYDFIIKSFKNRFCIQVY